MLKETLIGGLPLLISPYITAPHGFTSRFGGASKGYFESLNFGENRGDDPAAVRENYRRLKAALGIERLCFTRQVHKNTVRYVTEADAREPYDPLPYEADGLITDRPGLGLICFSADCIPILLHDPVRGAVAAVHAGWRGTVADIAGNAVRAMYDLGCDFDDIRAAIGPGIGQCCFETGPEVPAAVMEVLGSDGEFYIAPAEREGKYMVDLKGVNASLMVHAGMDPDKIDTCDECTACDPWKFWSHRVDGDRRGAQAGVIALGPV